MKEAGLSSNELTYVAFYDKPFIKFERLLLTYLAYAPRGLVSFIKAMPLWLKRKLWMKEFIKDELQYKGPILFPEHHHSHAASAFFPSPYKAAAILTIDGVGEWATASYGVGKKNQVELWAELKFPHSLGLLYSAFTYYTGFREKWNLGRALGNRSILGDARSPKMQSVMNLKIKFRESFRPFAPSVLRENVNDYFELDRESPYMLLVAPVKDTVRVSDSEDQENGLFGIDKLKVVRSKVPAITHVDYSARIQTVAQEDNPRYYSLLKAFYQETGCPVLINTSFNVRGEPIVCTPEEAFRCFMRTNMDYLVMGNFLLDKNAQTPVVEDKSWQEEFELD